MKSNKAAEESPAKDSAYTKEAGRNLCQSRVGASSSTSTKSSLIGEEQKLIEQMIERDNLNAAWRQVKSNKGAPGVDGRDFAATQQHIREHWDELVNHLLEGTYRAKPVERVEIPKPGGGKPSASVME